MSANEEKKLGFKPNKRKNVRKVKVDSDEEGEANQDAVETMTKIEEMKELQKLRQRPNGVNIFSLALDKKITIEEEITVKDPFKIRSGGMVNISALNTTKKLDDAYDTGIGTQFSVETNKRDEDEEMMKYIQEELRRRKGESDATEEAGSSKYLTPEDSALLLLPSHLRSGSGQKNEEMLSNQMLNGIPEVDLGIEAKIRNIEATEEAKQRMIQEQKKKQDGPSQFIPTNYAANYVQHDRFSHEKEAKKRQNTGNDAGPNKRNQKNATDDYYFDKFRNRFSRKN